MPHAVPFSRQWRCRGRPALGRLSVAAPHTNTRNARETRRPGHQLQGRGPHIQGTPPHMPPPIVTGEYTTPPNLAGCLPRPFWMAVGTRCSQLLFSQAIQCSLLAVILFLIPFGLLLPLFLHSPWQHNLYCSLYFL